MELYFLYKGILLGFSIAAPVGPVGILCINRTINKGFISGLMTGLGAATADLIYGLIAGLGFTIISNFLINQKLWIQLIGIIFLFFIGVRLLFKERSEFEIKMVESKGLITDYLTTFFLTITNPLTIIFFLTILAGFGVSNAYNKQLATILLIIGVFLGSGVWWLLLSSLTHKLKGKINHQILKKINIFSGLIIITLGVVIALSLF